MTLIKWFVFIVTIMTIASLTLVDGKPEVSKNFDIQDYVRIKTQSRIESKGAKIRRTTLPPLYFDSRKILAPKSICGYQQADDRFENDKLFQDYPSIDEYPWTALIVYKNRGVIHPYGIKCTGTIISDLYVITTAFCVVFYAKSIPYFYVPTHVYLGAYDTDLLNKTCQFEGCFIPKLYEIRDQIVHENYSTYRKVNDNDIALFRLESKIDFNDYIRPICFPDKDEAQLFNGMRGLLTGWREKKKVEIQLFVRDCMSCKPCRKVPYQQLIKQNNTFCTSVLNGVCTFLQNGQFIFSKEDADFPATKQWYIGGLVIENIGTNCSKLRFMIGLKIFNYIDWVLAQLRP